MYNKSNVFAKIIAGTAPAEKLYEDEMLIAIKNIHPAAPIHLLIMPKGEYIDFADFVEKATPYEISHYFKTIAKVAKENGLEDYRLVSNKGTSSGQSVFHFHTHILSGGTNTNLLDKNL